MAIQQILGVILISGAAGAFAEPSGRVSEQVRADADRKHYAQQCGGCHMAYPAELLPQRSWERVLGMLPEHFGERVALTDPVRQAIGNHLAKRAADVGRGGLARRVARSVPPGAAPIRISGMRVIEQSHHELGGRYVIAVPGIGSISDCNSCHPQAAEANFSGESARVPGLGRWEE